VGKKYGNKPKCVKIDLTIMPPKMRGSQPATIRTEHGDARHRQRLDRCASCRYARRGLSQVQRRRRDQR
jgi:hypothetical protein